MGRGGADDECFRKQSSKWLLEEGLPQESQPEAATSPAKTVAHE
jgi:hypothetical protein